MKNKLAPFSTDVLRATFLLWKVDKKITITNIVLQAVQALLPLGTLYYMKALLDALGQQNRDFDTIVPIIVAFGLIQFLTALTDQYAGYINTIYQEKLTDFLSSEVLTKAVEVEYEYYENPAYHDTLHLAQQQSASRVGQLFSNFNAIVLQTITLVGLIWFFVGMHSLFALLFILLSIPLAVIKWYSGIIQLRLEHKFAPLEREANYLHHTLTTVNAAKEVRVFNFGHAFIKKFRNIRHTIHKERRIINKKFTIYSLLAETIEVIIMMIVFGVLAKQTWEKAITLGSFVIYIQGFQRLQSGSKSFLQAWVQLFQQRMFLRNIFAFFDIKTSHSEESTTSFHTGKGLSINNLSFSYPLTDRPALINVSLKCEPGKIIAIVGENGSGKSTLVKLLARLYEIHFEQRDDYYEGLLEQFEQAVKCRTRSHFGVGTQLSGGMDSSAITGVAARLMRAEGRELYTLSNTLADDVTDTEITKLDERRFIDEVNKFNHIKNPLHITSHIFENHLAGIDFSILVNDGIERWDPTWLISLKKTAMQHNIRTLLSGFPGDELITYRGKFYFLDYLDQGNYLKYFTAKKKFPGFSKLQPLMSFSMQHALHNLKIRLNINNNDVKSAANIFNIPKHYLQHITDFAWNDSNFQNQFKSYRHFQKYRLLNPHVMHRMESETRYGLYFKTEPRFPMADIRLAQYYLSMPNEIKYEGTLARTAFRKAMKNDMPQMILERDSKYGSVAPFFATVPPEPDLLTNLLHNLPDNGLINKAEIIRRIELNSKLGEAIKESPRKVRIMSKLPDARVLRWLEKNPDVVI